MKKLGRTHRPYFRICAVDGRRPRDGRVLEELGTYDPMIRDVDARARLNNERISYWLGVGAQPSDKVKVLIKKYGPEGSHSEAQAAALERLAAPSVVPDAGAPTYVREEKKEAPAEAAEASESTAAAAATDAGAEAPVEEAPAEEAASEEAAAEEAAAPEAAVEEPAAEAEAETPAEESAEEEQKSE
ncbi:MAG: 30S ribosomal protein S16 [Planctomycetota bacterium]|nr:MAG: 30S ribosomal protein S16 [Planctomycetota bacterium]REK40975.1 MAG: 30S ribosomal protein S16 [Planctomycetota bacterium]